MADAIDQFLIVYRQAVGAKGPVVKIKVSNAFWTKIIAETVNAQPTPMDKLMGIPVEVDSSQTQDYILVHRQSAMLNQMFSAVDYRVKLNNQLLADGWVWSDETRQWTHPDKPGSSISY